MNIPNELRYAKTHEWALSASGQVRVGITDYAQKEISDIVHVELPALNIQVKKGQPIVVVESVKAAFDVYAPCDGTVTKVNEKASNAPEIINQDPYGSGWLFEINPAGGADSIKTLMDASEYKKFVESQGSH